MYTIFEYYADYSLTTDEKEKKKRLSFAKDSLGEWCIHCHGHIAATKLKISPYYRWSDNISLLYIFIS